MLNKGKLWENFGMSTHFKPSSPRNTRRQNRVRIIGGKWRSRLIEFPDLPGLRPTGDRVRETLFNWLGQTLHGKACLDLFAGSGALGFEAASRGAEAVWLIESNPVAVAALLASKTALKADCCEVRRLEAMHFLKQCGRRFDLILVDPPFASGVLGLVLESVRGHLEQNGLLYVEWGEPIEPILQNSTGMPWQLLKQGKAGVVHFALLRTSQSVA